jgi:hypothetical protein
VLLAGENVDLHHTLDGLIINKVNPATSALNHKFGDKDFCINFNYCINIKFATNMFMKKISSSQPYSAWLFFLNRPRRIIKKI